ncbi:MAG: hypothetical protein K9N51_13980 [Candidatus Pacebacteria bacterium]|nr:hypothetical protein [Candidatus Paceibacterota bacterium]
MPVSNARRDFERNFADVDRLVDLHDTLVSIEEPEPDETPPDFSEHKEVVLKSAIVLMVSFWEAYVEDICAEAIEHLVASMPTSEALPKELKKQIATEIAADKNELRMWDLADAKWKEFVHARLSQYCDQRNWKFNSPKAEPTAVFLRRHLGIEDVTKSWTFEKLDSQHCRRKLDEIVEVRGAIAHRGKAPKKITLDLAKAYADFLKRIISKTGGVVNAHVKRICGTGIFKANKPRISSDCEAVGD